MGPPSIARPRGASLTARRPARHAGALQARTRGPDRAALAPPRLSEAHAGAGARTARGAHTGGLGRLCTHAPPHACELVRMASQSSPHARLRRAIASGNATLALAAAAELPHVTLDDALALVILLRDDEDRFDR